jgi:membrane-associated phospholipid phosphatase
MTSTAWDFWEHVRGRSRDVLRDWLVPSRTMHRRLWPPAVGIIYIAIIGILGGLRSDHVIIGLLGLLDLYNEKTRLFLKTFFPFILTGVVYDSMRYFYWQGIEGRVHVAQPYLFERRWFGIDGQTLNEIFLEHHWVVLDIACGLAYLTFVAEYLGFAFLAFAKGLYARAATFARCFFVMNVMGFATYFIYPSAPPWYVTQYGLGPARMHIAPEAAAASRFDALFGSHFFASMYGRGVDVFGAIPSLHAAYPFTAMLLVFSIPELRRWRLPAAAFFLLMCLSAVYLQHHYVLDVLLGLLYALAALAMVTAWERWRRRRNGLLAVRSD